ncbi:ribosome assembly protein METTL17, mitochondrial-like [Scyliorhinus torazame]|uniref:ribosome assembly protein METTL17, mitochondrial-like n=1 Tax=Scyliorhinus torazame TaxID=75743 RepID=UPI003B5A6848
MEARDAVLKIKDEESAAHVFAPCPHDLTCPKLTGKAPLPCNFVQAYHPLSFAWNTGVKLERFSYLVLRRGPREEVEAWPRVVRPVLCRPRHVHAHVCCADGTLRHMVLTPRKSGRDLYRWARNSSWGDRLPVPPDRIAAGDGTESGSPARGRVGASGRSPPESQLDGPVPSPPQGT